MINWKIEKRKIKDLKPHPHNPRKLSKHDAEHLQKSIEKFGLIDKPIVQGDMIIGGHQRIAILKKQGVKEIECWVPDRALDEKEVNELCLKLNRVHGEFDWDLLANNFDQKDLIEWCFDPAEFGVLVSVDESLEEGAKKKKMKTCPSCGHEF